MTEETAQLMIVALDGLSRCLVLSLVWLVGALSAFAFIQGFNSASR